ncbi:MAG: hypothetical protein HGB37_01110 [Candidatus Moranbacteria bacterium]|nr:hypothetical protein [Candidatus Moranbacteria bacterium]
MGQYPPPLTAITGASGAGKTTLENALRSIYGGRTLVSTTTRLPRSTDRDGEYEHITRLEFIQLARRREFLTWMRFVGCYYGIRLASFREVLTNTTPCFRPITPEVIPRWHEASGGSILFLHLLSPPETVLRHRLSSRDGDADKAQQRIAADRHIDRTIEDLIRRGLPIHVVRYLDNPYEQLREAQEIIRAHI